MKPAEYYLKELLFEYDCVTIPGLGGFIMQSQPARISRGKNRINPPSRFPSFNSLLTHDDGLLISSISKKRQISYREASAMVSDFASNCKKKLAAGEKIILEGIGELSPEPGSGIQFRQLNQVNFSAGIYGMEPVNLYAVERLKNPPRLTHKPADRTARQLKEKKPAAVIWTMAFSLPIILFLLYGIIFPTSIRNIYTNYSGIVFDLANHKTDIQKTDIDFPEITAVPETKIIKEDKIVPEIIPAHEDKATPEVEINPEVKTEPLAEAVAPPAPKYYVIGGCFENEANASKFLAELIRKGFEAETAGTNLRGHVRVSYKSFTDKANALSYLQKIRNEENATSWLLKY